MRSELAFAIVLAASCGKSASSPPQSPAHPYAFMAHKQPRHRVDTRCELTPEAVMCSSTNLGNDYTVECVEPYVVVKETGDILDGKRKWCSGSIAPGATDSYVAIEGFRPADECGASLARCEVWFLDEQDSMARLAELAREADKAATRPGTQPTWRACDEARRAWLAAPEIAAKFQTVSLEDADMIDLFCKMHLDPAQVACFGKATTLAEVEACPPRR